MGGAVSADFNSVVEIMNSSFLWNKAGSGGGALAFRGNDLAIQSSLFEHNTASMSGEAISSDINSIINILDCCFKWNSVRHYGGAILSNGKILVIKSTIFQYNTVVHKYRSTAYGGAVAAGANSNVHILDCSFKRNRATLAGGAIYMQGRKLVIESSLFDYNAAMTKIVSKASGGAVFAYISSIVVIFKCYFKGNRAAQGGGALFTTGKELTVELSSFEYNTALSKDNTLRGR